MAFTVRDRVSALMSATSGHLLELYGASVEKPTWTAMLPKLLRTRATLVATSSWNYAVLLAKLRKLQPVNSYIQATGGPSAVAADCRSSVLWEALRLVQCSAALSQICGVSRLCPCHRPVDSQIPSLTLLPLRGACSQCPIALIPPRESCDMARDQDQELGGAELRAQLQFR